MNLADYVSRPKQSNSGEFLKWTQNGETKVLRFLYTSHDGADIEVVKKIWSDEQKKFLYDTPDGKLTCVLHCALYERDAQGSITVKKVRWERSANFTEQVCNGYWSKFPRIIDGVWEVTCTNPGTKDIKFAWFPVMGADLTTYPLPEGIIIKDGQVVDTSQPQQAPQASTPPQQQAATPKKYWED